jgi:hypothetical protein
MMLYFFMKTSSILLIEAALLTIAGGQAGEQAPTKGEQL